MITHYIAKAGRWVSKTVTPVAEPPVTPPPPPPTDPQVPTPPTPPTTSTQSTPWLPFDMPTRATLRASKYKVFAHYFLPYPISVNNSTNYYEARWLPPGTIEGTTDHTKTGGFIRDEPLLTTTRVLKRAEANWQDLDFLDEVKQAISGELDGFTVDLLNLMPAMRSLMRAVNLSGDTYFKLIPMPDGNSGFTSDPLVMADNLAEILKDKSAFKFADGSQVVAPFGPERAPNKLKTGGPAWWQQADDRLSTTHGLNIKWWFCYVADWLAAGQAPAFDSMAYGHSRWGDASYASGGANNNNNRTAATYSRTNFAKPWMHPVRNQDTRPNAANLKWWEAYNTQLFRNTWMAAIDSKADWVQIPTFNDYSEHAHIAPSRNHGYSWMDLNAYYLSWYKTGTAPTVIRDTIYLSHRIMPTTGVTYTGPQTLFEVQQDTTGSPAKNTVEALCFLKAPATVSITVGATTTTFDSSTATPVSPGVYSFRVPLLTGNVSAKAVRSGVTVASVTTGKPVSTTQISEDFHYRMASSRR